MGRVKCTVCNGQGQVIIGSHDEWHPCPRTHDTDYCVLCNNTNRVKYVVADWTDCDNCDGLGFIIS